jgi:hypothetical protein
LSPFGLVLILQSSSFPKVAGCETPVLLGLGFSLSPVEPTLEIKIVGSTGE